MKLTQSFVILLTLLSSFGSMASSKQKQEPLHLRGKTQVKKTTGDRFIKSKPGPQRQREDFGVYSLLLNDANDLNSELLAKMADGTVELSSKEVSNTIKKMPSKSKPAARLSQRSFLERKIAVRILDAPNIRREPGLKLIDCSVDNQKTLLAVALDQSIYLWNTKTEQITELMTLASGYISSLKWMNRGNVLAVGTSLGTIEIWDANRLVRLRTLTHNTTANRVSAISWNQHILSAGGADGRIVHFDVRVQDAHIGESHEHSGEISALVWNENEHILAAASSQDPDHSIAVWNLVAFYARHKSQERQGPTPPMPRPRVLKAHTDAVYALAWQPGSTTNLYSGSRDKTIKKWNILSEKPLKESHRAGGVITELLFDNNSNLMATAGKYFMVFDLSWKKLFQSIPPQDNESELLAFTKIAGTHTVACLKKDETIRFYEPSAGITSVKRRQDQINLGETNPRFFSRIHIR